jgi:hypothetical protein
MRQRLSLSFVRFVPRFTPPATTARTGALAAHLRVTLLSVARRLVYAGD